jgi:DNA-binding response OmpR family regulator
MTTSQRVLIVDDAPDIAELFGVALEQFGHHCVRAENGQRALELALTFQPQVVLLDLGLPDITGFEVARILRTARGGADMFIAAITGWGQPEYRDRALAAGIDRHLLKPIPIETIVTVVRDAARRQSYGPSR